MQALERPAFETDASEEIYRHVERHGAAERGAVLDSVSLSPRRFREELDRLKSSGYLEERGGTLRLALDIGSVSEHEADGVTYTVRPGRHSDFEGLVETIRTVTDEKRYVVAEHVAEQLVYEDAVTRHNTVESRVFFVATVDDEVVGWTHLDLPQTDHLRDTAQLTVGVREEYRGRGIGHRLLRHGVEWAESNGYRKVYNSVPATNEEAVRFLSDHGWDTEAVRRDHYTIDGEPVDEVMMAYTP